MNTFCNDVNDWLTVGGDLSLARDLTGADYITTIAQLQERGVTHVIDCRLRFEVRDDHRLWAGAGLPASNLLHLPIDDQWGYIPPEKWYAAIEEFVAAFWMESCEGDRLYVHCHMGINRGPTAAMLALLTVNPTMHPAEAFQAIREVRPAAGLVYAEAVGCRHLLNVAGIDLKPSDDLPSDVIEWSRYLARYWTPTLKREVNQGIAFYRSAEDDGRTIRRGSLLDTTH